VNDEGTLLNRRAIQDAAGEQLAGRALGLNREQNMAAQDAAAARNLQTAGQTFGAAAQAAGTRAYNQDSSAELPVPRRRQTAPRPPSSQARGGSSSADRSSRTPAAGRGSSSSGRELDPTKKSKTDR
jgi:hypothetical protein